MIFVCLGTKRFQFNRLLKQIDLLVENNKLNLPVFAQIGSSSYIPKNYSYEKFISPHEYNNKVSDADIIITHGGTGAIVKALKAKKQVIAIPRREMYGEHSDDHQLQIVHFFNDNGFISKVEEMNRLEQAIINIINEPITKRFLGDGKVLNIIDDFINQEFD